MILELNLIYSDRQNPRTRELCFHLIFIVWIQWNGFILWPQEEEEEDERLPPSSYNRNMDVVNIDARHSSLSFSSPNWTGLFLWLAVYFYQRAQLVYVDMQKTRSTCYVSMHLYISDKNERDRDNWNGKYTMTLLNEGKKHQYKPKFGSRGLMHILLLHSS